MITPVNNSAPAQAAVQVKAAASQQAAQTKPQAAPSDTVKISSAAQLRQESVETSVQTAKEAAGGDPQAKRLLAREAADHAPVK
jgi:hypothetical protein